MPDTPSRRLAARWIGASPASVWGLSTFERLARSLVRAGVWDEGAWTGSPPQGSREILLFLADHVYDDALVKGLARRKQCVLLRPDGRPVAAHVAVEDAEEVAAILVSGGAPPERLNALKPAELVSPVHGKLRKREEPLVLPVTVDTRRAVEDRLFDASYKGVTDAVTKYVWPIPARAATRWCVRHQIAPNAVTVASLVLTIIAFVLFREGWLGWGLMAAWAMTFLDTVDGKLARVTLNASRLGDVLDHGLDLVHPPFWWWAWWVGAGSADADALVVVVLGYILLRLQEGMFLKVFGLEIHVWRPFDSKFRLITARRNPILVILTVAWLFGAPQAGFALVALWTLASLMVHAIRILMAGREQSETGQVRSWLEQ